MGRRSPDCLLGVPTCQLCTRAGGWQPAPMQHISPQSKKRCWNTNIQSHCETQGVKRDRYSLFYGRNVLSLKLPFGEKLRSDSPLKEQPLLGHLHQDEPYQLPHVQPADHLLESAGEYSSGHPPIRGQQREAEPSCAATPPSPACSLPHHGQSRAFLNCCIHKTSGKGSTERKTKAAKLTDNCLTHSCFPGLRDPRSISRSNSVLMSSSEPSSPKAPHSVLMHILPSSPSTRSMCRISSM